MAAKLQCEICGGKLIGKPGGIFECDSCGVEYSTEWAKMKIQEIRGTVTVEGTVEVTGKVQVDGPVKVDSSANKEALLQRGVLALEVKDWKKATKYFDQALNMDAKCGEGYLGLAMAENECCNREAFASKYTVAESKLRHTTNITRAKQYGSDKLLAWFLELDEKGNLSDKQDLEKREQARGHLAAVRKKNELASKMIAAGPCGLKSDGKIINPNYKEVDWSDIIAIAKVGELTDNCHIGLRANGTVMESFFMGGSSPVNDWKDIVSIEAHQWLLAGWKADGSIVMSGASESVRAWTDIVSFAKGYDFTVGLKSDGTVIVDVERGTFRYDVSDWKDVVAISAESDRIVGLKSDGTVVAVGSNRYGECNVESWRNIVAIATGYYHTVGLKADGTVVAVGENDYYAEQCNVSNWSKIVAICADGTYTVGLRTDGTVIATGTTQQLVHGWKLFDNYQTIEAERAAGFVEQKREREQREAELKASEERLEKTMKLIDEKESLQRELNNLYGLFTGKRRREIEARLTKIDEELGKR